MGPGTELKTLLGYMGFEMQLGCSCRAKAALMDQNGTQWCREHRDEIAGWLRESYQKLGWLDLPKAVALAASSGLMLKLNVLDPFGSLVDEAVRRAECPTPG